MYLFNDSKNQKTFEIVLDVLNSQGKPSGKRQSYSSYSAYKIWAFYMKKRGGIGKKKSGGAVDGKEAEKILQTLYKDK